MIANWQVLGSYPPVQSAQKMLREMVILMTVFVLKSPFQTCADLKILAHPVNGELLDSWFVFPHNLIIIWLIFRNDEIQSIGSLKAQEFSEKVIKARLEYKVCES